MRGPGGSRDPVSLTGQTVQIGTSLNQNDLFVRFFWTECTLGLGF
jgi:hypothetical protein